MAEDDGEEQPCEEPPEPPEPLEPWEPPEPPELPPLPEDHEYCDENEYELGIGKILSFHWMV